MKIALLHGAVKNAGDFLIFDRTKALLKYRYPDCLINEYYRNTDISPHLDEINQNDILILAGGPGYVNGFYPDLFRISTGLNSIKIPIMILGMGWWGCDSSPLTTYSFQFTKDMLSLLARAVDDTKILGCRDFYSANILRNNGIDATLMTGCPAWYDLQYINKVKYEGNSLANAQKICVSDCVQQSNYPLLLKLLEFLTSFFPKAHLMLLFHRGIDNVPKEIFNFLQTNNCTYKDISNSHIGLTEYNDCDLHIGFRVHAHIYNLSRRNLSILLEEDSRGAGVNSALGLPNITSSLPCINNNQLFHLSNESICLQVEDYIFNLVSNNYFPIECAYQQMQHYFSNMIKHIDSITNYI